MDVILTPTKLSGTIQSRPSTVSVFLHETARRVARLQGIPTDGISSVCPSKDILSRAEIGPEDIEGISGCLDAIVTDTDRLNCGSSPSAFYLCLPIAAAFFREIAFVGNKTLLEKAIEPASGVLSRHGVAFGEKKLKIKRRDRGKYEYVTTVSGPLQYGHYSLIGRENPWLLTGLLFTLPLLEGNSSIRMTTLPVNSQLANMTVDVLKKYGISIDASVDERGYPYYEIPGSQTFTIPDEIEVEGDWASAAFWLGCGALGGNVTVRGLDSGSPQLSKQILDKLHTLGAAAGIGEGGANVTAASLKGNNLNAGKIPGLIPILSVALASASGSSSLTDIGDFDADRIVRVLNTLGANVTKDGNALRFDGRPVFTGGDVDPGSSSTAILVAAAASCVCSEAVLIRNAGQINKYYPGFFDIFEALGGRIRILP